MIVRRILEIPLIYDVFQCLVGSKKRHRILKNEYIGNVAGLKILELGCGTSDILECFEETCDYIGVDIDEDYIKSARLRYSNKSFAKFICADVNDFARNCDEKFDLILMTAVIHHISDDEVERCFESIKKLLKENGRFISFDCVYREGMSRFEKFLVDIDRGQYVRTESEYVRLADKHWDNVKYVCRADMMYLPFNLIIFINRKC